MLQDQDYRQVKAALPAPSSVHLVMLAVCAGYYDVVEVCIFNWPMTSSGLSQPHILSAVVEHKGHRINIWDRVKVQHTRKISPKIHDILVKLPLFDNRFSSLARMELLISPITITKIDQFFIPTYNLTPKISILPGLICKYSHVIEPGHWSVHEEFHNSICSQGQVYGSVDWYWFVKDQVMPTIHNCLTAAQLFQSRPHPQQRISLYLVCLLAWCHFPGNVCTSFVPHVWQLIVNATSLIFFATALVSSHSKIVFLLI